MDILTCQKNSLSKSQKLMSDNNSINYLWYMSKMLGSYSFELHTFYDFWQFRVNTLAKHDN